MSRFDAVFLYGVVPFRKGASTPSAPDWKDLQKRFDRVIGNIQTEDYEDAITEATSAQSDFDLDGELQDYILSSENTIQQLHGVTRGIQELMDRADLDSMNREEMISLFESVRSELYECSPPMHTLRHMATEGWFNWHTRTMFYGDNRYKHICGNHLMPTTNDIYQNKLVLPDLGDLQISAYANGALRMETMWTPATLIFTSDNKIVSKGDVDSSNFTLDHGEFVKHFEDWRRPQDDEIALFDVVHPGMNWEVLRYLMAYEAHWEKKYLKPPEPVQPPFISSISIKP